MDVFIIQLIIMIIASFIIIAILIMTNPEL